MSMREFENDADALNVLRQNFRQWHNGCICPKRAGYTPDHLEVDAINYLLEEWDFSYDPKPR